MIRHLEIQRALRAHLQTLVVATTGAVSLAGTATGYSRASGSFLADGFAVGMELVASGFTAAALNGTKIVTGVTALTLSVEGGGVVETAGTRTLTVGLPSRVVYESTPLRDAPIPTPYVLERYLGGPATLITIGTPGTIEATPQLQLVIVAASGRGNDALMAYGDAILAHCVPGDFVTTASGEAVRFRGDVAPFRASVTLDTPGRAALSVTIPLRLITSNS